MSDGNDHNSIAEAHLDRAEMAADEMRKDLYSYRGAYLPRNLQDSLDAYVKDGRPTGGFLEACIDNSLKDAVSRADDTNVRVIFVAVNYLYNRCPMGCWGFPGAHDKWVAKKREEKEKTCLEK